MLARVKHMIILFYDNRLGGSRACGLGTSAPKGMLFGR